MCGITGWVAFNRDLATERETVQAMTDTMSRRGPDAAGIWIEGPAALGHRRLAVIDIPGGVQPMTVSTADGAVTLTFSGEVYNFAELRRELRRLGHVFQTRSDTEVVLHAYLRWGTRMAVRLNGMYAFAIWDSRSQTLVMVRDRLGVKPLYFYPTGDGVLFGSEPKAVYANPLATRVLDLDGLRRLLGYVLTLPGASWAGLREVAPGTVVTVGRTGSHEHPYWTLATREHTDDLPTTVRHVRELLDDIVRRQLVADVSRCVLLSGGLDSSTLTALSARRLLERDEKLHTFSVDFVGHARDFLPDGERADPDAPYVRDMVNHVGSRHADIVLDQAAVADPALRRAVVRAYDLPPGSGDRDRSLYLLFKAIRDRSTVALSGESADELFGGYGWFHDPEIQRSPMFPWVTACMDTYAVAPEALAPGLADALDMPTYLADQYASAVARIEQLDGAEPHERRMRVASHLHLTGHLRALLDRKDRLSMAVGLEVRVPFCDHRLVEYVYNAPWRLKSFDRREKSLLRSAVRDLLPASVLTRVKSAFPTIRDARYEVNLRDQARELAAEPYHPVFAVVDRAWLRGRRAVGPAELSPRYRNTLEWTLNLAAWLEDCSPQVRLA